MLNNNIRYELGTFMLVLVMVIHFRFVGVFEKNNTSYSHLYILKSIKCRPTLWYGSSFACKWCSLQRQWFQVPLTFSSHTLTVSLKKLHKFISRTESATAAQTVNSSAGFRRPQVLQEGPGEVCAVPAATLPVWCHVCLPAAALPPQNGQQLLLAVREDWQCWLCTHRHLCGMPIFRMLWTCAIR